MTSNRPPRIESAPGLVWRPRKDRWEARWQARSDLVKRGYLPKSLRLWQGTEPDEVEIEFIRDMCRNLQDEMKTWARGGHPRPAYTEYNGTLASLIDCYQNDKDSSFHQLRFATKVNYQWQCSQILGTHGDERLEDIKGRHLKAWHEEWLEGGKVAKAHGLIGMMRTLVSFGATILECEHCERLAGVLSKMRFTMPKARTERLTAEYATAIRSKAHEVKKPSIALAQAFQFECMLRQKDVIGEWVPISEPGVSSILSGNRKWLVGLRWEEIDQNLVLRHVTSKRQKPIEIDLKQAPMVMEEFAKIAGPDVTRDKLPASGPVIVNEETNLPYRKYRFNPIWREIADMCGVPKQVYNMDTRAGAISEATDAGVDLELVRHAATHSNISTTQRYSRGGAEKTVVVLKKRAEYRNKTGT